MKSFYKRIIAGFFVFVTLFFMCMPPVYAADVSVGFDVGADFWDWLVSGYYKNTENPFKSFFDKDVCPSCPDASARHNFVERRTTVDGKTGLFYICEYCGKSAGEVGKEAYDNQVAELPATGITSAGAYIWKIVPNAFTFVGNPSSSIRDQTVLSLSSQSAYVQVPSFGGTVALNLSLDSPFLAPVAGTYSLSFVTIRSLLHVDYCMHYYQDSSGILYSGCCPALAGPTFFKEDVSVISTGSRSLGTISFGNDFLGISYWEFYFLLSCVPLDFELGDIYNINSRPTSITGGNYGIVGDNGEITTITNNNQIVNETNNTYYNPATGQTSTISDWSYNYEDRSYTLTLECGDTTTVTYGDENISITENNMVEGDTIVNNYTIYYMIDGSGSDDPSPAPSICPHSWQESSRTEPACTSPGKVVYTCSQCGQTKSETLKALGHDWQVERTVKTLYDENGNVTQQGYTIYQCSICGEQYKDADSTGPPDNTVNDGGLIEWLNGLIKHLSDNLSGAVDLILSFFQEIPKLFGGFLDFLSAMFPYLPDDIIFLLTFGIAALVFVGVIKAIRR